MEGERGIGLLTCRAGRGRLCPMPPAAGSPACSAREAPLQLHSQGSSPGTSRKGGHTAVSPRESPQSCIGTPKSLISAPLIPPLPAKPSLGASPRDNQHKKYLKASSVLGGCRSSGDSKGWSRQKPPAPLGVIPWEDSLLDPSPCSRNQRPGAQQPGEPSPCQVPPLSAPSSPKSRSRSEPRVSSSSSSISASLSSSPSPAGSTE